jgi:hypothetical protein
VPWLKSLGGVYHSRIGRRTKHAAPKPASTPGQPDAKGRDSSFIQGWFGMIRSAPLISPTSPLGSGEDYRKRRFDCPACKSSRVRLRKHGPLSEFLRRWTTSHESSWGSTWTKLWRSTTERIVLRQSGPETARNYDEVSDEVNTMPEATCQEKDTPTMKDDARVMMILGLVISSLGPNT